MKRPGAADVDILPSGFKVHDQGDRSTCTAHALTAVHEIVAGRRFTVLETGKEELKGATVETLSRLLGALGGQMGEDGRRRHVSVQKVPADLLQVKQLLKGEHPLVAGIRNFAGDTDSMLSSSAPGTHSVALCGFADDDEYEGGGWLRFVNSHGQEWGDRGCGTMSYGFFFANIIGIHRLV